jgi:hypothetical protein
VLAGATALAFAVVGLIKASGPTSPGFAASSWAGESFVVALGALGLGFATPPGRERARRYALVALVLATVAATATPSL